jgi:predicted nucleic acid-binding protein
VIGLRLTVVDASLATMWALPEAYSASALSLASDWARLGIQAVAPCFMLSEVTNAIHRRMHRGLLTFSGAQAALDVVLAAGVRLEEDPQLHRQALALAARLNRPTTYDAHYLALGQRHACEVWTGDERLFNAVRAQFPWLRWIGNYVPAP